MYDACLMIGSSYVQQINPESMEDLIGSELPVKFLEVDEVSAAQPRHGGAFEGTCWPSALRISTVNAHSSDRTLFTSIGQGAPGVQQQEGGRNRNC